MKSTASGIRARFALICNRYIFCHLTGSLLPGIFYHSPADVSITINEENAGSRMARSRLRRFGQFRFVIVEPQRGQRLLLLAQVVPQLEHWLSREGFTGFTGPQA